MTNDDGGSMGGSMGGSERWQAWRDDTPAMIEYAYMNSGFSGPKRRATHAAVQRRLDLELMHGSTTRHALDDRFDLAERYREAMGRLVGGASPDEIAIMGNTTEGINIITNGLEVTSADSVVTTSVEHGSGIVPAYYQRERTGCEVVIVPIHAQDFARPGDGVLCLDDGRRAGQHQARHPLRDLVLDRPAAPTQGHRR